MESWIIPLAVAVGLGAGWFASPLTDPYCGESTRRRRITMALAAAAVLGALAWRFGVTAQLVAFAYVGVVGVVLGAIDFAVKRLPDPFTLPSYIIGPALFALAIPFTPDGTRQFVYAIIGLVVLWLVYGVQHFLAPSAIGRGDLKLSGVLGLAMGWLGFASWMVGVFASFLFAGVYGLALVIMGRATRKTAIAFGPFMLLGALAGILFGNVVGAAAGLL